MLHRKTIRLWVEYHLGTNWIQFIHTSPRKDFFLGNTLIDDQLRGRGQKLFSGMLLPFVSESILKKIGKS